MPEIKKQKKYYNPSQKAATAKYNAKAYDEIKFRIKKGVKPLLKELAASQDMSLNEFILTAVEKAANEANFDLTVK